MSFISHSTFTLLFKCPRTFGTRTFVNSSLITRVQSQKLTSCDRTPSLYKRLCQFGTQDSGKPASRCFSSTAASKEPLRKTIGGNRYYEITDKEGNLASYPSVTTVLGDVWKGHLKNWAVKVSLEQVEKDLNSQVSDGRLLAAAKSKRLWKTWLKELRDRARKAPNNIRDEAGNLGTECHDSIDKIVKGEILIETENYDDIPERTLPVVKAFLQWQKDCNIELDPVGDQFVWSEAFEYAGAMDAIGRDKTTGELVAVDFKTSNQISKTYALQIAAYAQAYEEMHGEKVSRAVIVKFNKYAEQYEQYDVTDIEIAFNGFKSALYLWRLKEFEIVKNSD
mmetsp:Transcript_4633/g.5730  ORF Transcript_4633/g.5730 Transcript_4633/m.5730 type:complete len:337 (-) Transcript_4633:1723-2733(-)